MRNPLLRLYLAVRRPRNFLILLCLFIATSLSLHFAGTYDADLGLTNLILSIEASTAGAVLMMVAEESSAWQKEHSEAQGKMLAAVLAMAEAQRDMLADHTALLRAIRDADERLLKALTQKEE